MRVTKPSDAKRLGFSDKAQKQISKALKNSSATEKSSATKKSPRSIKNSQDSPGEKSLGLALSHVWGWWREGGDLVAELQPFSHRRIRFDFALPAWLINIEVDGWANHGEHLDDHHSDRARDQYIASYNWLSFRVSHYQATKDTFQVIECIKSAMAYRAPLSYSEFDIIFRKGPKTEWAVMDFDYSQLLLQ